MHYIILSSAKSKKEYKNLSTLDIYRVNLSLAYKSLYDISSKVFFIEHAVLRSTTLQFDSPGL